MDRVNVNTYTKFKVSLFVYNYEWHQYDGVVSLKPDASLLRKGINWFVGKYEKDCEAYASTFAKFFCPTWFRPEFKVMDAAVTYQESIDHLESLYIGLRNVYVVDVRCFKSEEEYASKFAEWIISPLADFLARQHIITDGLCIKIIRSLSVVEVCEKLKLPLVEKTWQKVCKCLLVNKDEVNKTCVELKDVSEYFEDKKQVAKFLEKFVARVSTFGKNPCWLYCMPLIHFLEAICLPFAEPTKEKNHDDYVPKWWGIAELKKTVDIFKRDCHKWKTPIVDVIGILQPLFEMDFYLPRSIIASMRPYECREIIGQEIFPVEVCCATICFYIEDTYPKFCTSSRSFSDVSGEERTVIECITKLKDRLKGYSCSAKCARTKWWLAFMISFECIQKSLNTNRTLKVMHSAQIFLSCISIYKRICEQSDNELGKNEMEWQTQHDELTKQACDHVLNWLNLYANEKWNIHMAELLTGIMNKSVTSQFMHHFCKNLDVYCGPMQDCLNEFALKAVEDGIDLDVIALGDEKSKFSTLLSEMFQREWRSVDEGNPDVREERILKMVLSWSTFRQFLKSLYKSKKCASFLSENCQTNIEIAITVVHSCAASLIEGNINIGTLRYIQKHKTTFCEVVQEVMQDKDVKIISSAVDIRMKEVQAFEEQADQMKILVDLCSHLPTVCTGSIETVLQKFVDIENYQVSEFCNTNALNEDIRLEQFYPEVYAFDVPDAVCRILPNLKMHKSSFVFEKMWDNGCRGKQCTTLGDVVGNVWFPVKWRWDRFVNSVATGDILFQEFDEMVGNIYKDDEQGLFAELRKMSIPDRCARERIEQLKQYTKLESCVKGAKVIMEVQHKYALNGDFKPVENIVEHTNRNFKMKAFDQSLMKTCVFLEEITAERAACLSAFVDCSNLVMWLRESMQQLKELKVFVDLAIMSAGDDPMNLGKVECLHTAVTGYSSLIFDLKPDSGYGDLLDQCKIVWKDLKASPNLPHMLVDTNRELEWLKDVEKAHGSVEVTSFIQADAINSDGIYTIGRMAWSNDGTINSRDKPSLVVEDVLRLTVRPQTGKRQKRDYTLTKLQDLTSRLMLVAGKTENGNESVENFLTTFDGVVRLCNVYTQLCAAGCVLFQDWSVRCLCDVSRPAALILQFGQGRCLPTIKGFRSRNEDLKDIVPELAKFMENCLRQWLQHIKDKRRQYVHLNFFTVDQLVILQRELVKVGTEELPSHLIYPLLSAVKQNCTPADLMEAMVAAKDEIDGRNLQTEDGHQSETDYADDNGIQDEKRIIFIKELVRSGYDEALAVEALEHVDPEDIPQGIVWCMDHEESTDADQKQNSYEDSEPTIENIPLPDFRGWSQSETSLQTMITSSVSGLAKQDDEGSKPLLNKLVVLWEQFLASITSNIRDYLSLEHLGLILRCLAVKNSVQINRTFPPSFIEGQPNIIVCPSADVIVTTLSIYMRDRNQPLPQADEILMCTAATTKDEVDIFWRRAIFGRSRKIYCLMNADMLGYDASEAAERCLEEYLQEAYFDKDLKYRLLVICGSDNEYRSTIVSSLDKYKRQPLPVNNVHLREYIASKLRTEFQNTSVVSPAAYVDSQNSTVRLIKSWRAGVGKTLFKTRQVEKLQSLNEEIRRDGISIPLHEKTINLHYVIERLLEHTQHPGEVTARLFHIDVAHEVENGVDYLLFNLLILGCLMDKTGFVWRKSSTDIYLIETMPLLLQTANRMGTEWHYLHSMLSLLPDMICRSPKECLNIYQGKGTGPCDHKESDQLFDEKLFRSPVFQRPFQYLLRLEQERNFQDVRPHNTEGTPMICLELLLSHCGIQDPSWSGIHHFVWFLNTQLEAFEENNFVSPAADKHLPGFGQFLLRFLILMSRDFSTRSLNISEETPGLRHHLAQQEQKMDDVNNENDGNQAELKQYQMRRTWESSPHPYLFFNSDRATFTFLGFFIDRHTGNLIDLQTKAVLEEGIMSQNLYKGLVRNNAPLQEDFDSLKRHEKIVKLCKVMGIDMEHDPDDTYELTTDNVKKMLAIYMRFRCDIPVIIMGETGCGKTRLIKFMCSLQMPPGLPVTNMLLMKVHGGTTNRDIIKKVEEAEKLAHENRENFGPHMYTVLFFDEANTTESIGLIKEIMCDKTIEGKKLKLCENLKIVAACNPYRKHADELIKKLEQAGLGYHVDADETTDRLGRVPMRRLVYRVQPLPQSLLPLVWDFGQLNTQIEDLYIRQMVRRYIREDKLPEVEGLTEVASSILTTSQYYMRQQKDECSFVSLRDVDRVLLVTSWFYEQSQGERTLYRCMDAKLFGNQNEQENERVDDLTRSLILALGVCYHACLKKRKQYRRYIASYFKLPCPLPNGDKQIKAEIETCQDVFLEQVHLDKKNIARNMALKENVFMMVVCIELRIPLFLVGKPGSSKSLAKTIVSDAMQGNAAREALFRELKQAQMVSFQCSPLSTPDGIVGTFRQCAQFQKEKNLETFVSTVVLDEVGLAEDSPRMPLKTLHPLLEDGCQGDEKPEKYKKVAFIGISNWALDPAKMNRGILVQREVPNLKELQNSARGICKTDEGLGNLIRPLIEPMAKSYLEIFEKATEQMREFFGLRDFYSLVKMVFRFVEKAKRKPTSHEMLHAIKRNFGGLDQIDPVQSFRRNLATVDFGMPSGPDPDNSPAALIEACLFDTFDLNSESRYLLLLTENYGALAIVQQLILSRSTRPITLFGSSFRSDQEYTQVCRNINKIKICMETGKTVVLLNLENLYESLYDALNQYYVYFGGARYVDLGLGTHRVKCPVNENF
ncbi:E3 ubiquitin-protein ligase rnf213-alpha-like, partial [Mercenaria mercenaria]|uniref:E3 ubiquitin-protein ligase rnf213-alpha-like n=1 Tax=Mercenaria mercenaria TaxID=6596 RepID=UPI00234ECD01